ncbi:MAG: hypothetical protein KatS3mg129_2387 [Leptospiraceae bacterium]|nr:MAG: hypothetical protein KatS3mg129_2387 [Leptospiraceae bacterium]
MKSDWKELKRFFTHPLFFIPILIPFLLEIILRIGLYDSLLKPLSYAANIKRIQHIIKYSSIDPQILIIGTSVPYQGLLLDHLNQKANNNIIFQSIATQGAYLTTQTMLLKYTLKHRENIKYMIHFADLDFPWQERYDIELANRSMLAQFPINETISLLKQNQYKLKIEDYRFFYIKILTYQNDLRDFLLNPYGRLKSITRFKKQFNPDYAFINNNYYSIGVYGTTIEECIQNAFKGIPYFDKNKKQITDEPHRTAVLDTCRMANYDPYKEPGRATWEYLFYIRLKNLYQFAINHNIKIITILPPYSIFMKYARDDKKANFWIQTIKKIHPEIIIRDHRFVLDDKNNLFYFYDTIHLNRIGAEKYTELFYNDIIKLIQ